MLAQTTTARSIDILLRSTLADHPAHLRAFDLAIAHLDLALLPNRVSVAMKAEAAAAIMELSTSGQGEPSELARHAVARVAQRGFRWPGVGSAADSPL